MEICAFVFLLPFLVLLLRRIQTPITGFGFIRLPLLGLLLILFLLLSLGEIGNTCGQSLIFSSFDGAHLKYFVLGLQSSLIQIGQLFLN